MLLKRSVIGIMISIFKTLTNILKFNYFGVLASFCTSSFFIKAFSNESKPPNHLPVHKDKHFLFRFIIAKDEKNGKRLNHSHASMLN